MLKDNDERDETAEQGQAMAGKNGEDGGSSEH